MGHLETGDLRGAVRGAVLVPGDEGYDEESDGFQQADRHRPDMIVVAEDAGDVREALSFARRSGLPLAVQATGHGLGPAARGGVLVSTRRMRGITVDARARTAWIEAGVRAADLVTEAARYGLAPVNGSAPGVGIVSYALGGGVGLLGREFGYAADLVRRIDLVTGDGTPREVTAESEPELFWGLRGGGGAFGVVTGMEIGLVPVERIYGGCLQFDGGEVAEDVLRIWQEWTKSVPENMCSAVSLLPKPDIPQLPEPLRGRFVAQVHIAFDGPAEEGARLVEPLRAIGSLLVDGLGEMPYTESASIFKEPETPHPYRSVNAMLDGPLSGDAVRAVLDEVGPGAEAMCVTGLRHMGGAFAREPSVPNAVDNRRAAYLFYVLSPFEPETEDTVRALHDRALDGVSDRAVGRNLNFLYGPQDDEMLRPLYGQEKADRLARLKERYDPDGTLPFTIVRHRRAS